MVRVAVRLRVHLGLGLGLLGLLGLGLLGLLGVSPPVQNDHEMEEAAADAAQRETVPVLACDLVWQSDLVLTSSYLVDLADAPVFPRREPAGLLAHDLQRGAGLDAEEIPPVRSIYPHRPAIYQS